MDLTQTVKCRVRDLDHPGKTVELIVRGGVETAVSRMYMTAWVEGWERPRLFVVGDDGSETEVAT